MLDLATIVLNEPAGSAYSGVGSRRCEDKATLEQVGNEIGVTREQTVAFGDYLNDLEMMRESGPSFATANAHEGIIEAARYVAPSNVDEGVIEVLENILGE